MCKTKWAVSDYEGCRNWAMNCPLEILAKAKADMTIVDNGEKVKTLAFYLVNAI